MEKFPPLPGHAEGDDEDDAEEDYDMFDDGDGKKGGKKGLRPGKARKITRRRSTIRVFQKNAAAARKGAAGEANSVVGSMADTGNTQTNLPYSLINLAVDRHHNRHIPYIPNGGKKSSIVPATRNMLAVDPMNESDMSDTGSRKGSARSNRPVSRGFFGKKEEKEDSLVKDALMPVKGNELGLAYQSWMEGHLKMYHACIKPVMNPKNNKKCMCGREIELWGPHSIKVQKKGLFDVTVESAAEPQKWDKDTNCLVDKTTSYGLMLFREPDDDNNGEIIQSHVHNGKPYVRVAATDCLNHPEWIRDMLVNKWDLDPPRILLAVTGGAMAFDLPPKLDEMIRIGLQKAAKTESLWITTGGSNSGVMKYVGDAINGDAASAGSTCPVIALANWGIAENKEKLQTYSDGKPVQGGLVYYGRITEKSGGLCLDQNHSHYIVVDGGQDTGGKGPIGFGGEISSRAAIEGAVAKLMSTGKFGSESPVSTVLLAIQGGPGTVNTILESLRQNTPVVVVNGSGKSSNAVAYAKQLPLPGERANASGNTEEGLNDLICNEFQIHITNPMFQKIKKTTMECVAPAFRDLIHVYDVEYDEVGGEVKSLDVDLLNAVLTHNEDQWDIWSQNRAVEADTSKQVEEKLKKRDLSRVLRQELSLMWNRIDVLRKEMEDYGVLPTLAKTQERMLYSPSDGDITYQSNMREEVTLTKKSQIELIKIRGDDWLVKPVKDSTDAQLGWVPGNKFTKVGTCFADMVKLAQLKMLQFLLLGQKLDFVLLFLQGMREEDVTAFLGLRIRTVWEDAAKFGFTTGTEDDAGGVSSVVVDTSTGGKKRMFVDAKGKAAIDDAASKGKRKGSLAQFANRPAEFSRAASTISHVSELSADHSGERDEHEQFQKREDDARAMLSKIVTFDESDIALPPYSKAGWVADIANTHLSAWVEKKWMQKQQGFDMTESTLKLITGRNKSKPRDLQIENLGIHQQNGWQHKSEWFMKLLTATGYIISREKGSQLDEHDGITRIHDWDLLIDAIATTRHHLWLRKKLEDRWAYGPIYDSEDKISPYIKLFADLPADDQNFLGKYAKKLIRVLLDEGYWIWRPDMLERLYYDAAVDSATSGHVLRLFKDGMFWRSNILNVISELMGAAYVHDFSTFSALDPYFHLLVWAIICQRFELVESFWKKRMNDCIANGLVAATLAQSICGDVDLSPEIKSVYVDQALVFKARTLGVFKACVNRDSTQTEAVLLGRYPTAGWLTLWELAFGLEKVDNDEDDKDEVNGVEITSDAFTSQDLFVQIVTREWFGLVDSGNGLIKILLCLPFFFVTLFHVDEEVAPGSTDKSWLQTYVAPLTMKIDTSALREVIAPTISWSPVSKKITLRTPSVGATILFTTDGRDPVEFGKRYVPSKRRGQYSTQREGGGMNDTLDNPSDLQLPEEDMFTIKCFARKKGLIRSKMTEKTVNCDYKDMVKNHVPAFSIGPPPSKAHWQRYGGIGTAMFRMHSFYTAPYVTFWFHLTLNIVYILLFSYSAICPTFTLEADSFKNLNEMEPARAMEKVVPLVVFAWTAILATDEARQAYGLGLVEWWGDGWNKIDLFLYLNVLIVVCLRINWDSMDFANRRTGNPRRQWVGSDRLMLARCMFALGALGLWMRLLRMYSYSPNLGPKLVMIGTMLTDVGVFLSLLLVALMGYGVAMHAIMDPWRGFDRQSFMTIIFKPMFQMIGDTFLGEIGKHSDCLGEDFTQCNDSHTPLVIMLLMGYLIFSNIMLVNLLIAMMAATYERVDKVAKNLWSVQYIELLEEFSELLPIPPPFSFFYNCMSLLFNLMSQFVNLFKKKNNKVFPGEVSLIKSGEKDQRAGGKVHGLAYVERNRQKDEKDFMEKCCIIYLRKEEDKRKLDVAKKEITACVNSRFRDLDQLVKNIEFNVGELLKSTKQTKETESTA